MTPQDPSLPAPSAPGPNCLLTIALPLALEDELLDLLHEQRDLVSGFSVVHGQGLGAGATLGTAMEQVQGRARRVLVYAVMRDADVTPLVQRLGATLRAPKVFYWAVPLLACGRLGDA
jgi:hypothetical protein